MVKITIFQNQEHQIIGFDCLGHAGYADENDIVCAAASVLTINCINSIETLTESRFHYDSDESEGRITFRLSDPDQQDSQLLLQSLALGLEEIERNYEEYIDVIFEEV